jgi:ATP-binding cassette, subfamily C, bacterial CydD
MSLERRLGSQVQGAAPALVLTILSGFLGGLLTIFQTLVLSRVISAVFIDGRSLVQVMPGLWTALLIILLRPILALVREVSAAWLAGGVKANLRALLANHLVRLGPAFTRQESTGELAATFTQGIEALDAYFSQYLPQLALAVMLPLSILVVVFPLDWVSGLVFLLTAPLIPIFMTLIGKTAEKLTSRQWTALSRMSGYFLDSLQGLATLKMFNQGQAQAEKISRAGERYRQVTMRVLQVTFLSALVLELAGTISTAVVAVEIGLRVLYSSLDFSGAFFILLLAPEFYLPLRQLGMRFHAGKSGISAARCIFEVLDTPAPGQVSISQTKLQELPDLSGRQFSLEFEDIHFAYAREAVLQGVSFSMHSGQMTALVGPSGAGKTTLAYLLLRFIEPAQGEIKINGISLRSFPDHSWRSQVSWVSQRPSLFNDTLAANIRLGCPAASIDQVRLAAQSAHLDSFVSGLPQGYDTPVGEHGAWLSSGQAQRVGLARAFLKNAPVVVMDEPTAHLDPALEDLLSESIRRLCQGRTVLVIAHRLSTIQQAGRILVLEHGRLAEMGTHADLVSRSGLYSRLAKAYEGQA